MAASDVPAVEVSEMIPKSDLKIERIRGKGPGGQNKNKVCSCIRLTHLPTGIVVRIDGRDQGQNLKQAMAEMEQRLAERKQAARAIARKARRDEAIRNETTVRTYDYKSGLVRDHRTGRTASIKDVLGKGRVDLLQ
jgi:peptide chain release factor 1